MASDSDEFMVDAESGYDNDDMFTSDEEENFKSSKKASSKAAGVKTSALAASTNAPAAKPKGKKKTVEEIYQKKTQLEHILLRPDTYIGSVERVTQPMFVLSGDKIVEREITYTPGLYKIFDEIVVNAADNKQRDPNMDKLEITIDGESNSISVLNNGAGIPIVMHKEHNVHIPTLIFGHLLTGSNFDDNEKKTTGGRNGYGAKLANVFSAEFIVECVSVETGKKFCQTFRENMSISEEPVVQALSSKQAKSGDYVKITFSPDLSRFGMTHLDDDAVALLSKRAYDIAGAMANSSGKKLSVKLNGTKLPIKSFKEYLGVFEGIDQPVAYEKNERWEVGVAASPDQTPRQISFVNSICTSKGGQHVTYIADQVAAHLVKVLKKGKNKGGPEIKPAQVKNNLTVFVNCLIENPAFDSQTKEFMTTRPKAFGSEFKVSGKFLKAVEKSEIVENILSQAERKMNAALKRKGGAKKTKITGIPKLDDANFAGSAKSKDCTLIITEGDSAKSLAVSGISVVGRDYYGVFPLRGKLLNVRDSPKSNVIKNAEIQNLVEIMGLKYETEYTASNIKTLRYGHLMIMTDQDSDGSHIKGLVINFIHKFWPSLLDVPGFLQQFITPIVKVSKGNKSRTFFTLPEYEQWRESTGNNGKGFSMKYYKGLGTSTSAEAKEYFSNLDRHEICFTQLSLDKAGTVDEDFDAIVPDTPKSGSDLIDLVFRKTRVEDRKAWLNTFTKDTYLDYGEASSAGGVKYSDFINKEFILFSKYDNERSIPCVIDGFKPSQRKVLFACFKRKLKGEVKVAQLTGYIAEHSAYHHGEQSLQTTIVNMAQSFVGSNNVNLLTPSGQFGTRLMGGKDSASPRYIFTKLEPITRTIFHPDDDQLLTYLNDDGLSIEPEFYCPVIPLILVNGADGIGTGYSTAVPNYNPREIIANLRRMIAGEEPEPMVPFYSGFTGELFPKTTSSYEVRGRIERIDDTTLMITELPIKKWTQDYKQFLEEALTGTKTTAFIKDFKENHTETTVSFTVTAEKDVIDKYEKEKKGLLGKFKLTGSVATSNMTLFDTDGKIVRYESALDILSKFYEIRHDFYVRRKEALVHNLESEQKMLSNKARFIDEVCAGDLVVSNRKRSDILADLRERGYDTMAKDSPDKNTEDSQDEDEEPDDAASDAELAKGYEYLLGMKIWSLTYEKAEALRAQLAEKTEELETMRATAPSQIWLNDLEAIEVALDARDEENKEAVATEKKAQLKSQKRQAKTSKKKAAAARKKKKKKDEWDSEMETSSDEERGMVGDSDSDDFFATKKKPPVARPKVTGRAKAPATKAPAKATKAPAKADMETSSDEEGQMGGDSGSDDDFLATKEKAAVGPKGAGRVKQPATKAPAKASVKLTKAPAKADMETSSDEEGQMGGDSGSDDDSVATQKKAAVGPKVTGRAKQPAPKARAKAMETDSDSEFEEGTTLMERLKKNLVVSPPTKGLTSLLERGAQKRPSPRMDDYEAENAQGDSLANLDADNFSPVSLSPAKKQASTATQPLKRVTNTKGAGKQPRGKPTKKSKTLQESSDSDEFAFNSDSGEDESPVKKAAPAKRARRARAVTQMTYSFDSDEDSFEEIESEEESFGE